MLVAGALCNRDGCSKK